MRSSKPIHAVIGDVRHVGIRRIHSIRDGKAAFFYKAAVAQIRRIADAGVEFNPVVEKRVFGFDIRVEIVQRQRILVGAKFVDRQLLGDHQRDFRQFNRELIDVVAVKLSGCNAPL